MAHELPLRLHGLLMRLHRLPPLRVRSRLGTADRRRDKINPQTGQGQVASGNPSVNFSEKYDGFAMLQKIVFLTLSNCRIYKDGNVNGNFSVPRL